MELKTAEFVSPNHPDKMCDRISDAILDLCISKDKNSRVAVETLGGHGKVFICGEITCKYKIKNKEIKHIVKRISGIKNVEIRLVKQSPEIANGVDTGGAGDQGIMIGYACEENEEMIPQELYLAKSLCKYISELYGEDGKTQITLRGNKIDTIVASWCKLKKEVLTEIINYWLKEMNIENDGIKIYCNMSGDWNIGGFDADTGLTGRKIAVDNYGTRIPIGGGCFSGKDATKVDRSGAYKARQLAIREMKERNVKEAIVKIAYCIGKAEPLMITVETKNGKEDITEKYLDECKPRNIIKDLKLKECSFEETAIRGHFGNNFNWEQYV